MINIFKNFKKQKQKKTEPLIDGEYKLNDIFDDSGLLIMRDNEGLSDFLFYCSIANKTKTFFDRVLLPQRTYINIQHQLAVSNKLNTLDGKNDVALTPFTQTGIQTLYGLTDPVAKRNVKVYTIKPDRFLIIN